MTGYNRRVKVIVRPLPQSLRVSINVLVAAGARHSPAGAAHLAEHLLLADAELDARLESWGGTVDAETGYSFTRYYATVRKERWRDALEALLRGLNRLDGSRFARERELILRDEAATYWSDPLRSAFDAAVGAILTNGAVTSLVGTRDERLSLEDVARFHRHGYTKDRLYVALAGAVEPREAEDIVARASWPATGELKQVEGEPRPKIEIDSTVVPFEAAMTALPLAETQFVELLMPKLIQIGGLGAETRLIERQRFLAIFGERVPEGLGAVTKIIEDARAEFRPKESAEQERTISAVAREAVFQLAFPDTQPLPFGWVKVVARLAKPPVVSIQKPTIKFPPITTPALRQPQPLKMPEHTVTHLESGMKLIRSDSPGPVKMTLKLQTPMDEPHDPRLPDLIARCLFAESLNETSTSWARRLARTGARFWVLAQPDGLRLEAVSDPTTWQEALDAMLEAAFHADLPMPLLRKQCGNICKPPTVTDAILTAQIGRLRDRRPTTAQLSVARFYSKFAVPAQATLALVGRTDERQIVQIVRRYDPRPMTQANPAPIEFDPAPPPFSLFALRYEGDIDPIMPYLLGHGRGCRLYRVLRGACQIGYAIGAALQGSALTVWAQTGRTDTDLTDALRSIVDSLTSNPPNQAELDRAFSLQQGDLANALDQSPGHVLIEWPRWQTKVNRPEEIVDATKKLRQPEAIRL